MAMRLKVDYKAGQPVHEQILVQMKQAVSSGAIRPGESLPSIGSLAEELRVGRNNVAKAYAELESLGLIELLPGSGYKLKEHHRPLRKEIARQKTNAEIIFRGADKERSFAQYLPNFLGLLAWLALIVTAMWVLARFSSVAFDVQAATAVIMLGAIFLPLRSLVTHLAEKKLFPKQYSLPRALEAIRKEAWNQPTLTSFLAKAVEITEAALGKKIKLIHEHGEVLDLANHFPALRSARDPLRTGGRILMPFFSKDELLGVLELEEQGTDAHDLAFLSSVGEQVVSAAGLFLAQNEKRESEYAFEIQRALLPRDVPQPQGFTIAGAWQPAKNIGGDYYDAFQLPSGEIALVVADVAGKGVAAALMMANVQALTRAYTKMTTSPAELCRNINNSVCESISDGRFVTFFICILDPKTKQLRYCNAGHNPPLLVSQNGDSKTLSAGGLVLGLLPNSAFEETTIQLTPGDRLLIFTDGMLEAEDSSGKEFGEERLFTAMTASPHVTAAELRDSIMQAVTRFCRGDFGDDATLLALVVDSERN